MADMVECAWPVGARLGEGPVWCADDGALWFVDIKGCQIHCLEEATGARRSFATPELAAFIFRARGGGFLCGLKSGLYRFEPSTGAFERMVAVDAEHPGNRLNDGFVDAAGRLWFGTMDDRESEPTGSLYCYAGGHVERMDAGYVITNGPAMSPDGKVLYHVDTLRKCVFAFDVDPRGALSGKRIFISLSEPGEFPDGPVVDSEGNVWLAIYGGWGVRCYSPAGRLLRTITLPAAQCTKAAFGGSDLRTLYITTAAQGLSEGDRARQPQAGGLFRVRVEVPGLESHAFSGWG